MAAGDDPEARAALARDEERSGAPVTMRCMLCSRPMRQLDMPKDPPAGIPYWIPVRDPELKANFDIVWWRCTSCPWVTQGLVPEDHEEPAKPAPAQCPRTFEIVIGVDESHLRCCQQEGHADECFVLYVVTDAHGRMVEVYAILPVPGRDIRLLGLANALVAESYLEGSPEHAVLQHYNRVVRDGYVLDVDDPGQHSGSI